MLTRKVSWRRMEHVKVEEF